MKVMSSMKSVKFTYIRTNTGYTHMHIHAPTYAHAYLHAHTQTSGIVELVRQTGNCRTKFTETHNSKFFNVV